MPCIACYTNCFPPSPLSTLSFAAPPECETPQLNCGQYVFNKTYCIPPHYRCDMIDDCEDKSDEAQCSKYSTDSYATLHPSSIPSPSGPSCPYPCLSLCRSFTSCFQYKFVDSTNICEQLEQRNAAATTKGGVTPLYPPTLPLCLPLLVCPCPCPLQLPPAMLHTVQFS